MKLFLVLGDNLFPSHPKADKYVMIEDESLCTHFKYHKHKLVFYLAAMRAHGEAIGAEYHTMGKPFFDVLKTSMKGYEVHTYYVEDKFFRDQLESFCDVVYHPSPKFLCTIDDFKEYRSRYKRLLMNDFYIEQRKTLNILMDGGKPVGGQWSYDADNRKKLPRSVDVPDLMKVKHDAHVKDVIKLVNDRFSDHPGNTDNFYLPTTRRQALAWLNDFLKHRFKLFGDYEDAITEHDFVFHSVLSPLLNCGLLTPKEVLDKALKCDVPINSMEGFVRQIIGWREYVRGLYHTLDMRGNHFGHTGKLTKHWYDATTGIEPLDDCIDRVNRVGYTHHIERLMVVGNSMLLSGVHPDEVHRWFMEMYVDSTYWVMEANVYGMSQYADGASFATKPYICGSSYLKKMGCAKGDWCDTMDGLYWYFIHRHKKTFASNQRMSMMVRMLEKMDPARKKKLFGLAKEFIARVVA